VTNVQTNHPENKGDVAAYMCHRVATAEKHYRFIEKQRNSLKCTQIIHDTLSTPVESTSQILFRPESKTQQLTDDTNAGALRSCTQVQHSAHSSHTQQSVVACARTAPLHWFLTGGPATTGCPGPFLFS